MITIGTEKLPTSRPADIDAAMMDVAGCSAPEMLAMLTADATPALLARAVKPFLKDERALADLGVLIAAAGVVETLPAVRKLYDGTPDLPEVAA